MRLESRVREVIKISFLLGISTMIICLCIGDSLGKLFFDRYDLGVYIRLAALSAPFMYVSGSTFGILNGLGKQKALLINSVVTSIIQLILLYILLGIPSINILGYGIALLISSILSAIMNIISIKKSCYIEFSFSEFLIDICLSTLLYFILTILNNTIPDSIFITKNIIIIVTGFSLLLFSLILNKKINQSLIIIKLYIIIQDVLSFSIPLSTTYLNLLKIDLGINLLILLGNISKSSLVNPPRSTNVKK